VFHDNFDTSLSYSGQWTTNTVQGIPNNTVTAPFHQTVDAGASAQMNFSSAVAVAVHASTNFGHGLYSVVSRHEYFLCRMMIYFNASLLTECLKYTTEAHFGS
jgi:hypothetical protein